MLPGRSVPTFLVFLAIVLTSRVLLAASCLVDPEPQAPNHDTWVRVDDPKHPVPQERLTESKRYSDCTRLVLVKGIIHVLYETPDGVSLKTCKDPGQPCSVNAGTWPSWLDVYKYQTRPGGKKMDEALARLRGVPYGRILHVERAATFNLAKAGLPSWKLTLLSTDEKTPIYRLAGSEPVVQIPGNLLRSGGKYTWLIDGNNQTYKGGFDLLGVTEAEEIAKQIKQGTRDAGATARARKLDELIVLYENNLDYEVELLREELRL
jgi:hypothetical protein